MKTPIRRSLYLAVAATALASSNESRLFADTYSVLHNFTSLSPDGYNPASDLCLVGSTLYGTTRNGGNKIAGTIYAINTNGSGYHIVHNFGLDTAGHNPDSGLVSDGAKLYGTTSLSFNGTEFEFGTIYSTNSDGSGFQVLHSWPATGTDGRTGQGDMILLGSTLYGTTGGGGPNNGGIVYKMGTNGSGYQILHSFGSAGDGSDFYTGLISSGSTLYGLTNRGGAADKGTVFKMNTDGTGYQILRSFSGSDGAAPLYGHLSLLGSTLYGVTSEGGSANLGALFSMNTDGSGYQLLHSFLGGSDGTSPSTKLTQVGSKLYGETYYGGPANDGTIFSINPDGTGYAVVRAFSGNDGANPRNGLLAIGNTLYGTTETGGTGDIGTVFALTVPEPSTFALSAAALISFPILRPPLRTRLFRVVVSLW